MKRCRNCGEPIDTSEWYPVETVTDEDGNLEFYEFCSISCRETYLAERG